jgi:septum site-determining protein MinD
MADANIIGVVSIKGGVGKTTATSSIGVSLAEDFGKKVLIIDANLGVPNLGFHFNNPFPEVSLFDVLNDKVDTKEAIIEYGHQIHLLLTPLSDEAADLSKLGKKLEDVRKDYDFILLDSSPTLGSDLFNVMEASDELLPITSPDYPTMSAGLKLLHRASEMKIPVRGVVVNKFKRKHFEIDTKNIADALQSDILAIVPDDEAVAEALYNKYPVTLFNPYSNAALKFRKVAAMFAGTTFSPSFFGKLKYKIGSRGHRRRLRERFGY